MKQLLEKYRWPLIIFLAAFFIRLIYLIQYRSNPAFYYPMVDELWHLKWAREIITDSFWGDNAYFRGPLYPYLLAPFLKITGDSIFWSRFLQIIIGSFSSVLVYLLGTKTVSTKAGIIAGLAYAAYSTIFFYEAMFLIPVIFIFLNLLAVHLLILFRGRYIFSRWFLAGIVIGLSAIARPNILLLIPFFLIWIYVSFLHLKEIRRRATVTLIYLLGVLIPVFSVTLRNYLVTDEFFLISSQGGVNLYIGNNSETDGLTMLMPEVRLDESLPWSEFTRATREAAENEIGRKLTAGEESAFWTGKALNFILHNPGKFISMTFQKLVYFLVGFENSDQTDIYASRKYSSIFSLLLWKRPVYFPFGLIFPLAVVGMVVCWPRRKELSLLYIFILVYIPTVILFLVTARHRLPVIPFMLIFGAAGAITIWEYIRQKKGRQILSCGILFIIVLVLANRTYFDIGFENPFQTHLNLALTYERQGDLTMAEKEYREALQYYPYSATTLNNLGMLLHRQGRSEEAMTMFQRAIQSNPDFADAYNNMGLVYESRQNIPDAERSYKKALSLDPGLHQAYLNLGDIYLSGENFAESEKAYLKAREIAPENKDVYFKLGAFYARVSEFAKAEEMFLAGEKWGEPGSSDYINWGNIYFSTRQPDRAIELYRKAINKDPNSAQAHFNLALTFYNFRWPADSTRLYIERLLRINPDFGPARELLERINQQGP
jgi:tetratricopeptide (TPR) repeat protein